MILPKGINIPIATSYDGKGVKAAEASLKSLKGAAKELAKAMGVGLSVSGVVYFLKQSTAAAIADTKAQKQLAQQLTNVGLSMQNVDVERFISKMQYTTGVLDDQLRPAFSKLVTLTGSVADSQDLLKTAFDVSAGTGMDLSSAVNVLSQAYVGNLKGLKQLNLGLTQAEIKGKSFGQILDLIKQKYQGAGMASVNAVDKINVAVADLKEQVGNDFLKGMGFDKANANAEQFQQTMQGIAVITGTVAKAVGNITAGWATAASGLSSIVNAIGSNWKDPSFWFNKNTWLNADPSTWTGKQKKTQGMGNYSMTVENAKNLQLQKAQIAAANRLNAIDNSRLNTLKKITQETKNKALLDQASSLLNAANALFDPEQVQLAAAMAGKLTQEELARLKVKKDIFDLEAAINSGSVSAAAQISASLVADAERLGKLRETANGFNGIINPFDTWLASINAMNAALQESYRMMQMMSSYLWNMRPTYGTSTIDTYGGIIPDYVPPGEVGYVGSQLMRVMPDGSYVPMADGGIVTQATPILAGEAGAEAIIPLDKFGSMGNTVNITVQGSVVTQQQLIDAISSGLQNKGASGIPTSFSRNNSPYIA